MDEMKSIIESLATIAKRKAGKFIWQQDYNAYVCQHCGHQDTTATKIADASCPTCQPLRKVAEMHTHEPPVIEGVWECSCGASGVGYYEATVHYNESFERPDIPALCEMLRTVGVWEKFCGWLWAYKTKPADGANTTVQLADILTSDKFYGAVEEFLKGEVENEARR